MKLYRSCCALVLATLACVPVARAADDAWDNNFGGSWTSPTNWVDDTTPGLSDTATFNLAQTYTTFFTATPTAIENLTVSAGTVTLTSLGTIRTLSVNSGGEQDLVLTGSSTSLTLGTSNPTSLHLTLGDDLQVRGGATLNVRFFSRVNTLDLLVGDVAGGNGTVVVDGIAAMLNSTTTTELGANGASGFLTYSNSAQGTLSTAGTVSIGHTSNSATVGTLNVESNADVDVGNLNIGTGATGSATGVVNVQGSGSTLDVLAASTLTVGSAAGGTGSLNIGTTTTSGAIVNTGTGLFTINARGTVQVGSFGTAAGTLNANGNVTIDGGVLDCASGSFGSTFALASGKTMTIQNGGRASFYGDHTIATNAIYTIGGANSKLETLSGGALILNNGAQVNVNADGLLALTGNVTIDDGVLTRGFGGTFELPFGATMTIQNAGRASFTGDYTTAGGGASYNITGASSILETLEGGALTVYSSSMVDVSSGGMVSSASSMDVLPYGSLTVSGPGSSAIADSDSLSNWGGSIVTFQNDATGSLGAIDVTSLYDPYSDFYAVRVLSGADLACGNLSLRGVSGGDYLRVDLSGSGSTIALNPGASLTIGDYTSIQVGVSDTGGSLTVGTGGSTTINAGSGITVGSGTVDLKTVTDNGGVILFLSGSLSYIGDLTVGDGGFLFTEYYSPAIQLYTGRQLTISGTTTVDATHFLYLAGGTLNTGSIVNNGTLNFDNGTLGITSNYTQSHDGTLLIHLGTDVNDFEKLQPSGTATLDGTLEVVLNSYVPQLGDLFEIIEAGLLVSGEFDEELLLLPALSGGLDWHIIYDTTTVTLEVVEAAAELIGDYNGDGKVSAADFTVWRDNVGASTLTNRDPNNSGDVDIDDFNSWKAHYGEGGFGSGAGATVSLPNGAAVPEPTALVLVVVGYVAVGLARSADHGFAAVPGRG